MEKIREQIEKGAKEYAYSLEHRTGHYTDIQIERFKSESYLDGAEKAIELIEHAQRWRSVEQGEFPEVRKESYQILVKHNYTDEISVYTVQKEYLKYRIEIFEKAIKALGITHWKPLN